MSRTAKCKHRRVAADKTCKDCGQPVDLTEKRNKYGNRKVEIDGIWFDSEREGKYYLGLKALAVAEKIFKLTLQPEFKIDFNDVLICRYRADFSYLVMETKQGQFCTFRKVVVDAKGARDKVYILKKKLMKARFNIDVVEV